MEKKKEAYEMQLQDKVESRMEILRKLSLKEYKNLIKKTNMCRKEKRDHSIVARITQEIGAYYKDKVTEKAKTRSKSFSILLSTTQSI